MDMDRYIGRLLDNRYEILEVIGTGGMAVVYKARCHRLNRLVAIKILKDDYSSDEEFRRRFHAEGEAVAMLSHPNIVAVYDVSTSEIADYIVMELIEGISLKQYMEKKGVLNWKETLHFGIQVGKALEHAHSRGIVHRDIKPHNIMVLKNGSVKVTDFGIARLMSKGNTLTKEALGSVHYISPEQAKGGRIDNRSDLYSLGVVMYEMMAGRPPYDGESPVAIAIQHINGGAMLPSTLNPNIPGGLEQIIMKNMAQDINSRYDTATQMLYDMEEFRKDPAILFDYNMGSGADLRVLPPVAQPERKPVPPKTTAERVAGGNGVRQQAPRREPQQPVRREQQPVRREAQQPARRPSSDAQRRRQQEQEERSNISTVAIVACSVVAVVAIVIFLVTMLNGGLGSKADHVALPNLVGQYYEDVKSLANFEIVLQERTYSEEYEKGVIIHQIPTFEGQEVVVGTKIYITVSSGPEPQVKTMEDLIDLDEAQARSFLDNQGMDLQILTRPEPSDTIDVGRVTRTDPAQGTELTKGQTVYLWISSGPDVETAKVPNVLGRDLEMALTLLKAAGFNDIVTEEVESDKAKGIVVSQSEEKNTDVDVTTTIYLEYSAGKKVAVVPMPNVVGQNLSTAIGVLKANGFTNIKHVSVESNEDKDSVVKQSVPEGFEIEVTAEIILEYSKGPKETTAPPTSEPTTGSDVNVTIPYTLALPTGMTEPYSLMLKKNGTDVMPEPYIAQPTETSIVVELTGSGVQTFELYVNGEYHSEIKVDFIPYG